jgi:predicted membrane-bound spermidine synthase
MVNGNLSFDIGSKINIEGKLYRDKVILSKQTKYQKIVVTKHKDEIITNTLVKPQL